MNILLAGHKGFIGKKVKETLLAAGHQVWIFDRDTSISHGPICHCDIFINCAGKLKDEDRMIEDNLVFAVRIANACRVFGKRLIHIGSISERTKNDLYANTKKAASNLVLGMAKAGADFCVVSPATVFGPGDHKNSFISSIYDSCISGKKYTLIGDSRDWVYIDDLALAILKLVESKDTRNTCFEVGYGEYWYNGAVFEMIRAVLKIDEPSYEVVYSGKHWYADTTAIRDLRWSPRTSFIEGIKKYVAAKQFEGSWVGAELS